VSDGLSVTLRAEIAITPEATRQVTPQVAAILRASGHPMSRSQLQEAAGLEDREHFRTVYLEPLLAAGWVAMTIPDESTSSRQRYRTTPGGEQVLEGES
jgi:ATP-dependent DNA helicase RecG